MLTCTPSIDGAAPYKDAEGEHTRNDVIVKISFPTDGTLNSEELAHFLQRATAVDGAFLTFDHIIHATNPSFTIGSACSEQLPYEDAVYAIDSATASDDSLDLVLTPANVRDTHHVMDSSFNWDPNTAREVSRRAAAGEPAGVDARRRLAGRSLFANSGSGSLKMNSNEGNTAATSPTFEFFPSTAGLLTCKNCYAFIQATYSVTFQFCIAGNLAGVTWYFTSQNFAGNMGATGVWATQAQYTGALTETTTADNLAGASVNAIDV